MFQEKVAKTACMSACKHIAHCLMEFLLDNNITVMTIHALQQFSLDVTQCERKASHYFSPMFFTITVLEQIR